MKTQERENQNNLEGEREGYDITQERLLEGKIRGSISESHDLPGKIMGTGKDHRPSLLALDVPGVGGFGSEDKEEGEGGGGELVRERGGSE